jgi:cardiolipin synthase
MRNVYSPNSFVILPLSLALLLGVGCISHSRSDAMPPDDLRTLPGRFAEEPVTKPLTAVEAYIGPEDFYVSYKGEDGLVYSGGNWSNRVDLEAIVQSADRTYRGPYILPLQYHQHERWSNLPEAPIVPRLLTSKQWNRFIERILESVLPKAEMTGIVMRFDEDDYFLYYNDINNFEARLIIDKPDNYTITESVDFMEFIRRGLPVLEQFMAEEGITERRLVFSTGDAGAYSLPFIYVDVDLPIATFVRYAPARREHTVASKETQMAQSIGHMAQSHLGGLIARPVSSMYRLLFVAKDAAVETVRPSWLVTLESQPIPNVGGGPGMDLEHWEAELDKITGRTAQRGTIAYLVDGEEYFRRFIDAVTTAKESVTIRTYIFDNDDYAEKIGNLLRRRSAEGINVRILLDGLGTIVATGADDETMPEEYRAPESVRRFLESGSAIKVRQSKNPWLVAGDHVKTTIIDGKVAFAGGMNIGREYRYVWHDLMMELRGPVVDELSDEFDNAWGHAGPMGDIGYVFHRLKPNANDAQKSGQPLRVLYTRPGVAEIFNAQRAAIRRARNYIYIENAYFTDDAMLYELAKARRRGVDVRIILPLVGNHGPINKSNALAANAMLENGIRVFVYPGMSHVKAAVFDGWACLGSANWDKLSFRTNKELNIATSHPAFVDELLERVFAPDFENSVELTEPFPERWSDHLAEIVADYLL